MIQIIRKDDITLQFKITSDVKPFNFLREREKKPHKILEVRIAIKCDDCLNFKSVWQ